MNTSTPTHGVANRAAAPAKTAAPAKPAAPALLARPARLAGATIVVAALALAPALIATVAGPPVAPAIADRVGSIDGAGYVGFTAPGGHTYWATSTDGHWFTWVTDGSAPVATQFDSTKPFTGTPGAPAETCPRYAAECFRTVPGTVGVVSTMDYVTWTPEFSLSAPQLAAIAAGTGSAGAGVGAADAVGPAPESLDIAGVVQGDLTYVYVANGSDGFAVRTSYGAWQRASTHPVLRADGTIDAATEIAPPPVPTRWTAARLAPIAWAGTAWVVAALALAMTLRRRTPVRTPSGRMGAVAIALGAAGAADLGFAWAVTLRRATPSWDPATLTFNAVQDGRAVVSLVVAALALTAGAVLVGRAVRPSARSGD